MKAIASIQRVTPAEKDCKGYPQCVNCSHAIYWNRHTAEPRCGCSNPQIIKIVSFNNKLTKTKR